MRHPDHNDVWTRRSALRSLIVSCLLCVALFPALAGTVSVSSSKPAVNGFDIANLGTRTGSDKFWAESGTEAGKAKGQTFRTGSEATVAALGDLQVDQPGNLATPTKTYVVRVGKVVRHHVHADAYGDLHAEHHVGRQPVHDVDLHHAGRCSTATRPTAWTSA